MRQREWVFTALFVSAMAIPSTGCEVLDEWEACKVVDGVKLCAEKDGDAGTEDGGESKGHPGLGIDIEATQ